MQKASLDDDKGSNDITMVEDSQSDPPTYSEQTRLPCMAYHPTTLLKYPLLPFV